MTGDEQFDLQESLVAEVDRNPHDNVSADIRMTFKAAWLARDEEINSLKEALASSRHETVEEIIKLCQQRTLAIDPVYEILAAIRARYQKGEK